MLLVFVVVCGSLWATLSKTGERFHLPCVSGMRCYCAAVAQCVVLQSAVNVQLTVWVTVVPMGSV